MRLILFLVIYLLGNVLFATPALAAATVTFDNQGTWIINGERFFLYGAHRVPRLKGHTFVDPSDWERAANQYHLNTVVTGGSNAMEELATTNNIYLIQGIPWLKDVTTWNNAEAKTKIRDQIAMPRRIMFYASEENILSAGGPVVDGYNYLATTYPYIPAHINFTNIGSNTHPELDDFLRRTKASVISSHVGDAKNNAAAMVRFRNEIPSLKSAYILFRINENPHLEQDIFASIVEGINGIFFWELQSSEPLAPADTYVGSNWGDVIARVGGYLREIKPGLVAPNREYKPGYMKSKGGDNRYYIVATASNLTVTGLPKNTQFEKLFYGSGTITTSNNGVLTDNSLEKIKIYRQKTSSVTPTKTNKRGDVNHDNLVNHEDFELIRSAFGSTYTIFHYNDLIANFEE